MTTQGRGTRAGCQPDIEEGAREGRIVHLGRQLPIGIEACTASGQIHAAQGVARSDVGESGGHCALPLREGVVRWDGRLQPADFVDGGFDKPAPFDRTPLRHLQCKGRVIAGWEFSAP